MSYALLAGIWIAGTCRTTSSARLKVGLALGLLLLPMVGVAQSVTLTPARVETGSPELIRVEAPQAARLDGDWLGRPLRFFRIPGTAGERSARATQPWYALAGVDVEAETGSSTLHLTTHFTNGKVQDLSRPVVIEAAHYRTGVLTVAPKFVSPGPDELAQIKIDTDIKQKVFAAVESGVSSTTESGAQPSTQAGPLWMGNFLAPVTAPPTDSFGTRRMFNGTLASIHKGMDFRAASGTPVRAGNAGTVVLAEKLYYEGNCVMIDHGLGLMSISMHLSRIDVKAGQQVARGERVGLSGATGRVTGPHLHWAIRWQGAYLDPAKLLKMDLSQLK